MTTKAPDRGESRGEMRLREYLRTRPLAEDSLARMRDAVAAEWRSSTQRRRMQRRVALWAMTGAAAAISAVWIASPWFAPAPGLPLGTVSGVTADSLYELRAWRRDSALTAGQPVRAGMKLEARQTADISLQGGGTLLLRAGTRARGVDGHTLYLESGTVYVDIDPAYERGTLEILTPRGSVRHTATEFEVAVGTSGERVRVREGAVLVGSARATRSLTAGDELTQAADGTTQLRRIDSTDPAWKWVEESSTVPDADGKPVAFLLAWVARRSGRSVQYADAHAREMAEKTILHGSVRGLDAAAALRTAVSTTTLRCEFRPKVLWVAAAGTR
ncbi:MAG: FecR domain-containing protein [Gammaproteobacteria bacterium]|nr:FecR domain-containing protein [Gammaproteobacteria bacterium]